MASGAYAGYAPIAPGTAGSLIGLALYWVLPEQIPLFWWLFIGIALFGVGVHTATLAEQQWGEDAPEIVIDEIVGCLVVMWLLPRTLPAITLGFLVFRILDVLKPFPAHRLQRLPGGWGVMADDLTAGLYAGGLVRLVLWLA